MASSVKTIIKFDIRTLHCIYGNSTVYTKNPFCENLLKRRATNFFLSATKYVKSDSSFHSFKFKGFTFYHTIFLHKPMTLPPDVKNHESSVRKYCAFCMMLL